MLKTQWLQALEQVRDFLDGSRSLDFEVPAREAAYLPVLRQTGDWIAAELSRVRHTRLGKADKRERGLPSDLQVAEHPAEAVS